MEIDTCEKYVLAQLRDAEEQIASLEMEVADLKRDLANVANELKRLEDEKAHGAIENYT